MITTTTRTLVRRQSLPSGTPLPHLLTRNLATRSRHHRESLPPSLSSTSLSSSLSTTPSTAPTDHLHLPVHADPLLACRQLAGHYWSSAAGSHAEKTARWRASSESVYFESPGSNVPLDQVWGKPLGRSASTASLLKGRMPFLNDVTLGASRARRSFHSRSSVNMHSSRPVDLPVYQPQLHDEAVVDSESYDDLHMYNPKSRVRHSTSGASPSGPMYDDLHLYRDPVTGPKQTAVPSHPSYADLHAYAHPIGSPIAEVSEPFPTYSDLPTYADPELPATPPETLIGVASTVINPIDAIIAAHVPVAPEDKSAEYTDLPGYEGPISHLEPLGRPEPTAEELSKNYKDLHLYDKPAPTDEPWVTAEPATETYKDLAGYALPHNDPLHGQPAGQESAVKYDDLHEYAGPVHHLEPNGRVEKVVDNQHFKELEKYGPVWGKDE